MPTPNTPGPGRVSQPVQWLVDENGYIVGYRNPLTQENVYGWFAGGSGGGGGGQTWDAGATWDAGTFWS
jgi:hypothetical protein